MEAENEITDEVLMDIYEPVIAACRAQIAECEQVIATLQTMRSKDGDGTAGGKVTTSTAQTIQQPIPFSHDSFFGMTIAEAAKKYLAATRKTATAKVITEALIAGGLKSYAKAPVENVRTILSRSSPFVIVNGEFGLTEWYPGRKVTVKKVSPAVGEAPHQEDPTAEEIDAVIAQVSSEPVQPSEQ